jgi:hypothetical protein
MTEVASTPLQSEEDALRSIQNALALFAVNKRSPSHCSISTSPTVSASSSPSRSLWSDQGSCDDSSDDADSSEQTVGAFNIEQAVINSIAETLSSQDAPEYERPEKALETASIGAIHMEQALINSIAENFSSQDSSECERPEGALESISVGGLNMEQAVINLIAETLSSQDAPEYERPEMVLDISDVSHAVEDEASPSGSLLSQMFFTCLEGSVFSTSLEPQSTDQPSTVLATNLSKYIVRTKMYSGKARWRRGCHSQSWDNDDASRKTDRTDKTEKCCNTSKEKKLEKMA